MSYRVYNFSPGPAVLPEDVLEEARQDIWNIADSGIGILEHSHRGKIFKGVIQEAEAKLRALTGLSDDWRVLFLQGGASTQFWMLPANLLPAGATADYLDTGSWSKKAIAEARHYGEVHVACTSKEDNYGHIPAAAERRHSESPVYVHYTSNNTIFGTEFPEPPATPGEAFLACDASSDILSRPIDLERYGVLYAGAQKNLGPSGVTLVVIRADLLERSARELPSMQRYATHAKEGSLYNTPPSFAIYVVGRVLAWIERGGGLAAMGERNAAKAKLLYDRIDAEDFYAGTARADSRSLMNVTFRTPSEDLDAAFVAEAERHGLAGLKGHRSVGGMRASIYNAFPREGCEALVQFMKDFAAKHG